MEKLAIKVTGSFVEFLKALAIFKASKLMKVTSFTAIQEKGIFQYAIIRLEVL